ncbi:MAG TPA: hypothetical protein PL045_00665 [Chitinophagaceae bacterium]|nr:hypothetical protein [Chitinophagaceae bacterium]
MAELIIKNGIGYGTFTKAAFYSAANTNAGKKLSVAKDAPDYNAAEWSLWGDNNDEPKKIADDIENCGVLSAGIESEVRLSIGKGVDAYLMVDKDAAGNETLEWLGDSEINDWLEDNNFYKYSYRNVYNLIGYGWGATQFILNGNRNYINRIRATDVYSARLEKRDTKNGIINNLYLSGDWSTAPMKYDPEKMRRIALLEEEFEYDDLINRSSGYEFALLHRLLRNGRTYYPKPLHRSAKAWVDITRSVPSIKKAMNTNQMHIKYLVHIAEEYWARTWKDDWGNFTPEQREQKINETYENINSYLAGEINAGKSIIAGRYFDIKTNTHVPDISIDVLDDKLKDGKMLPDSAAADKQILFSMFFNPAIWGGNLLGDGASGGAGSGSDIREATLVLLMLLHPERVQNLAVLNLVKKFNGWAKKWEKETTLVSLSDAQGKARIQQKITPKLVFRYSSSILQTLDKGGSMQPVTN